MDYKTTLSQLQKAKLYAILDTGYSQPENWPQLATQLITGGVGVIQIRAKKSTQQEIIQWTQAVHPITSKSNIPLIINDFPELVPKTGAEGAHIGQDDMDVKEARKLAGAGKIIGKSTHSLGQVKDTATENPDYIGFGPLFNTPTKPDYNPIGLKDIIQVKDLIQVPAFCIGGIKLQNVLQVAEHGAERVVIVSGLLQAPNPTDYAQKVLANL